MNSNTRYCRCIALLAAIILILTNTVSVFAAGTTSIKVSQRSAEVGDDVTVTVTGSESGSISVRYNNNVMELSGVSADSYTTNGNVVTFSGTSASLTFSATAAGSGDVVVSSDTLSGSSTSIAVTGTAATQEKEEEADEEEEDDTSAADDTTEGDFTIDGVAYVLSERFSDSQIPEGFKRTSIEFPGGTYRELQSDFMTLVYLKPASDTSADGVFYIYNEADNTVSDFSLLGSLDDYVIVQQPDELFASNLLEAQFTVDEETYTGYQVESVANDFYFVYGTNTAGESGWYQYDSTMGTVQRANTELVSAVITDVDDTSEEYDSATSSTNLSNNRFNSMFKKLNNTRMLLAILVFAAVVLLIIIIDIILFRRGNDDDDEDDFFEDTDETDNNTNSLSDVYDTPKNEKPSKKKKPAKKKKDDFEENEVEVLTLDEVLDDVEDDLKTAPKPPKKNKGIFRRRGEDIWDYEEEDDGTGGLPALDERSKLKKQVFRNDTTTEITDGKVDIIDLNDL